MNEYGNSGMEAYINEETSGKRKEWVKMQTQAWRPTDGEKK